ALSGATLPELLLPGLVGMVFSFGAGLLALRWVSSWIDQGRWRWFGYYCFAASAFVLSTHFFMNS
ncbi:MAG: undecaprenyl-diphosphate phosphatase, partial [Deltaproteobacteria bacterium]|nr:undecaprenyl-diphosphate phosphatase [Deltaproteobacteria bacterium]